MKKVPLDVSKSLNMCLKGFLNSRLKLILEIVAPYLNRFSDISTTIPNYSRWSGSTETQKERWSRGGFNRC